MNNYLDNNIVNELKLIMEDDVNMLYMAYLDDVAERLNELKSSLKAQNCDQTRRIAHTLKGSSRNVGAHVFSDFCESLEQAARDEKTELWDSLAAQMNTSFSSTKKQIELEVLIP